MSYIIYKDLYQSKKTIMVYLIIGLVFVILGTSSDNPAFIGIPIILIVYSVLARNELYEDKNKGYVFLKTLPLKPYKIVLSKYLLCIILALIGTLYSTVVLVLVKKGNIAYSEFAVILACGAVALLMSGVLFNLIYRYGAAKAISYTRLVFISFAFLPMVLKLALERIVSEEAIAGVLKSLSNIDLSTFLIIALALFIILMLDSIRIFYKKKY